MEVIKIESISDTEDLTVRQDVDGMFQGQITSSEGDVTTGKWFHDIDDAIENVESAHENAHQESKQ